VRTWVLEDIVVRKDPSKIHQIRKLTLVTASKVYPMLISLGQERGKAHTLRFGVLRELKSMPWPRHMKMKKIVI